MRCYHSFLQGNKKLTYTEALKRIYPATYIFDASISKYFYWGDQLTGPESLKKHALLYLFINGNKYDAYGSFLDELKSSASMECIYLNEKTKNRLFKVIVKK